MNRDIRPFAFYRLKYGEFFELANILVKKLLSADIVQELGVGKPYDDVKVVFDRLKRVSFRNPKMIQTEDLKKTIVKTRRKMIVLKILLKEMLADKKDGRFRDAKAIEYVARPFLRNVSHDEQSGLAAKSSEMANALRTTETLPKLTGLGLKPLVDDIAALGSEIDRLLFERGEERAFQRNMGTATQVRKLLEKRIRFLLYISIPAHHNEAAGELAAKFEHTIALINEMLDEFRHLTGGKHVATPPVETAPTSEPASEPASERSVNPFKHLRKQLFAACLALSSFALQAQDAGTLFGRIPNAMLPLLSPVNRADFIDFLDSKMKAGVKNKFGGESEMTELTDSYIRIKLTGRSTWEMKALPVNDSTKVICVVSTVCGPVCDSSVGFYTTRWEKIPTPDYLTVPVMDDYFQPADSANPSRYTRYRHKMDMLLATAALSGENNTLTFTLTTPQYAGHPTDGENETDYLRNPLVYVWENNKFRIKD